MICILVACEMQVAAGYSLPKAGFIKNECTRMNQPVSWYLLIGSALSAAASMVHIGAVAFGASWYRFLGAGERMVRMAEQGRTYPAAITLAIACILMIFSAYALSGAAIIGRLPLLREILCAVTAIYLLRAMGFMLLMNLIPGNSLKFWLASSGICLVYGVVHLIGLRQAWNHL